MTIRNYSNTAAQSTLQSAIAATDTTITLINYVGDPTPPFTAALARGTANEEIVLVTAVSGAMVTVTRGYDGTTAKAQSAGATFQEVVAALDFREANNHVNSGASGAHGTTSQVVGVSDTQTLTNKTLTAPTITNPTVTGTETVATSNITTLNVSGVSTLASLSVTANATVGGTLAVTGATTLAAVTASGVATLNGGAAVPTGKKITLIDAPVAGTDAANMAYVGSAIAATGTSAPTANALARRDANGRMQAVAASASADVVVLSQLTTTPVAIPLNNSSSVSAYRVPRAWLAVDGKTVSTEGVVQLLSSLSPGASVVIATLPAGYRPTTQLFTTVTINGQYASRLDVLTTGELYLYNFTGGSVTYGSASAVPIHLTFRTD